MAWAKCSMTNAKIPIYGIKRLLSSSDPAWERTDNAVGFTATASVGTVAGSSSFDKLMPWAGMVRSTFDTGDVMVKIPEFWYRRWQEDGYEYIQIAEKQANDKFEKHPGSGKYIGAYKSSSTPSSKTNVMPRPSMSITSARTAAMNKGTGWSLLDICTSSAIMMLYLVEYASNDSQNTIGKGVCNASDFINTGSCDSVPNLTGRPAGTDGNTGVIYRGIENLWGNIWEWVDGVNYFNRVYYVCTDINKYATSTSNNYTQISYTAPTSNNNITKMGYDTSLPWVMLPENTSNTSNDTFYCDWFVSTSSSEWRSLIKSGRYDQSNKIGMFINNFYSPNWDSSISYRIIYNSNAIN